MFDPLKKGLSRRRARASNSLKKREQDARAARESSAQKGVLGSRA